MAERAERSSDILNLPVVVHAADSASSLKAALKDRQQEIESVLRDCGGVLFRGFRASGLNAFHDFVTSFGSPLLSYHFGSSPRSHVGSRIYTSTEYPPSQRIPLHNEQSYTRDWPMRIWFHCVTPAESGGQTPIADSRAIYRDIPARIRDKFVDRKLMYVRNYGNGLDVPWETVFNTTRKSDVETYCRANHITCEWKPDGTLRTRQIAQAVAEHPFTHEQVWFNQAHLFHVSSLDRSVREALMDAIDEEELPRNVYYADGKSLELDALESIRAVIDTHTRAFDWQKDDVLMLDNMLTAHGRTSFKGGRKVLVAMAQAYSEHARAR